MDPQEVCAADEEDDCLKDEDACEDIVGATFCPNYEGGTTDKCGKFGKASRPCLSRVYPRNLVTSKN